MTSRSPVPQPFPGNGEHLQAQSQRPTLSPKDHTMPNSNQTDTINVSTITRAGQLRIVLAARYSWEADDDAEHYYLTPQEAAALVHNIAAAIEKEMIMDTDTCEHRGCTEQLPHDSAYAYCEAHLPEHTLSTEELRDRLGKAQS